MKPLRVLAASFHAQIVNLLITNTFWFTLFTQPLIFAALAFLAHRHTGQEAVVLRAVVGSGVLGLWNSSLWSAAYIVEGERREGTLEFLVASPPPLELMLAGKSLADSALAAGSMVVTLLFARVVCGVSIGLAHPWLFLGGLLLLALSLASLGLLIGSAFVLSRAASRLAELFNYPVYMLCGLLFPLDLIPAWARPLGYLLSPSWGMKVLEAAISPAAPGAAVAVSLAAMALLTGLYFLVARALFQVVLARVRQAGTLGVY